VLEAPARSGLAPGTQFSLPGDTTLGRDESNGIVLADPSISARHASIERTARGWVVRDLGSTNGTAVGSQQVNGRGALLRPGDEIRVGAVRFRFLS
jgi:pSer/pThr/pTyr-binding forkhead associated (FHA) protein